MEKPEKAGLLFGKLVGIMGRLRGEEGCPWDREQDEISIINYFLEEVYEAVEAVNSGNISSLAEELGDVLMEVVFLARIYEERRTFSISDVLEGINRKMIRRHPHVFGQKEEKTANKVLDDWQRQKRVEKERESLFDGLVKHAPSLLTAFQIGNRVSSYGFDWKSPLDALQKVKEEIAELEKALSEGGGRDVFQELGDVLFSLVNVSRLLRVNPELALNQSNAKFIRRFNFVEQRLKERGKDLRQASLEEMDEIWEESKKSSGEED